ncbi:MAG TPA: hypothetical protein VG737_09030 [Cyclobacteriaceae bacterium]|nr:hypothetical protein [Cyclobacteriaceae bacterium]
MKNGIATLTLIIIATAGATACDVCGCSLGGNYFGILPLYNKSFVGLRWSQASFHSYIAPTQNLAAQTSHDTYSKMELWGRYYLTKRIQLFAFIPYVYNDMNGTDQVVFAQGLGDVVLLANYTLFNTGEDNSDFKHSLIAGGGIKLPTGKFSLTDKGKIINRNFQMGTGSTDFNLNAVYTFRYRKTGVNLETGYKINTRNSSGYLFGNQFRASAQIFFWQKFGPVSILPHAGVNYEQAATHMDGDIIQVNTGGTAWLGSGGLDIYVNRFTVGVNYQKPFAQHYNSDETAQITGNARWTTSLTFNF